MENLQPRRDVCVGKTAWRDGEEGTDFLSKWGSWRRKDSVYARFCVGTGHHRATFTILQEYKEGRLPLYHFDVYRIGEEEEMDEIGYEDCFFGDGVCMVEWAEQIRGLIPESAVWICIEKVLAEGFDCRRITVKGNRL